MNPRRISVLAGLGVLAVALILRTWFGHTLWVRTGAMVPTVHSHEWVWVAHRDPRLGDVVQVQMDDTTGLYRVAAMEGQTLEIRKGRLFVDGSAADNRVAKTIQTPTTGCVQQAMPAVQSNIGTHEFFAIVGGQQPPVIVPQGAVFLLGDNRPVAGDSRAWGPWPVASISGVVTRIVLSWDACDSQIRWRRTGNSIE